MSKLSESLASGRFTVTAELNPPKGADLDRLFAKADLLKGLVTAFNLTDSHQSRMSMSPLAVGHLLLDRGVEPVVQVTCRDRNRLALQGDLLAAHALGVSNLLCMTGDPPDRGDHPDAKPVFDLEATGLLRAISMLQSGRDLAGNELTGSSRFFAGAVANPGAADVARETARMEEKVQAGAKFFQTQAVYEPAAFERFAKVAEQFGVPLLAGYIMLKSGRMARNLNDTMPGVNVPEGLIRELDAADDRPAASVRMAGRIIRELRPMCQGVHIMAIGWESRIPLVLEAAGLAA